MQFSINSADVKTFLASGQITLEEMLSEEEASLISFRSPRRDPHRENPQLFRLVSSRRLALMAANLIHKAPLRLAFTEWTEGVLNPLSEWASIQPIAIALLLQPDGSGTFINPQISSEVPKGLLIAYSPLITLYTYNLLDPHVHELKKYGYVFGDRVTNDTHPVVCKDFFS